MSEQNLEYGWPVTVSVLMPNHNCGPYIGEAIASIQAQTFQDWELVVVDDGSTDDSVEVIENLASQDDRINLICHKASEGQGAARNAALDQAKGRYIAFLDSDDLWCPTKLEYQLDFMATRESVLSFTWCDYMNMAGEKLGSLTPSIDHKSYGDLAMNPTIAGCVTLIYDRNFFGDQPMPEDLKMNEDYALWLRLTRQAGQLDCLQKSLGCYRLRSGSVSSRKARSPFYIWQILRQKERLSYPRSAFYFAGYAFNGLYKYTLKRMRR